MTKNKFLKIKPAIWNFQSYLSPHGNNFAMAKTKEKNIFCSIKHLKKSINTKTLHFNCQ